MTFNTRTKYTEKKSDWLYGYRVFQVLIYIKIWGRTAYVCLALDLIKPSHWPSKQKSLNRYIALGPHFLEVNKSVTDWFRNFEYNLLHAISLAGLRILINTLRPTRWPPFFIFQMHILG